MGGTISLESTVNEGSNFIIMLPGTKTGTPADTHTELTGIDYQHFRFRDAKILLVEDKESNRKVVRDFLSGMNVHLLEAENGKEAVDAAIRTHPQLILMDLQMPVMDGFQAIREIRKHEDLKHIPVVALTASAMKDSRDNIRDHFDDILIKPVTKKSLINKISSFLSYDVAGALVPAGEVHAKKDLAA